MRMLTHETCKVTPLDGGCCWLTLPTPVTAESVRYEQVRELFKRLPNKQCTRLSIAPRSIPRRCNLCDRTATDP